MDLLSFHGAHGIVSQGFAGPRNIAPPQLDTCEVNEEEGTAIQTSAELLIACDGAGR